MATGQAKTKAEELRERLLALAADPHPSEFAIRAAKKEAETFRKSDPVLRADALGYVASIEKNEVDMRRNYELALRLSPNDFIVHSNFGNALLRTDFFTEARVHLLKSVEINPTALDTLNSASEACIWSGWLNKAHELIQRYNKLSPQQESPFTHKIEEYLALIRRDGLTDQDTEVLVDTAFLILKSEGIYIDEEGLSIESFADGESSWLSYHVRVPKDVDVVVDLNVRLAERLAANKPRLRADEFITVMFVPGPPI